MKLSKAEVTLSYTPPDLDWLKPSSTARGIVQIASVDLDNRPVSSIEQGTATLFRINSAEITANPQTLPANGTSESAITICKRTEPKTKEFSEPRRNGFSNSGKNGEIHS